MITHLTFLGESISARVYPYSAYVISLLALLHVLHAVKRLISRISSISAFLGFSLKVLFIAPPRSGLRMRNPRGGARYYVDERDPKFSQEQPFLPRPRANSSAQIWA